MSPGWVIKGGYSYSFKSGPPSATDVNYPVGYIWIDRAAGVAYALASVEEGIASWIIKQPETIINSGTGGQINIIGENYLGSIVNAVPGSGSSSSDAVVSTPGAGEYKITNIRLDGNKKLVVTHDEEPVV